MSNIENNIKDQKDIFMTFEKERACLINDYINNVLKTDSFIRNIDDGLTYIICVDYSKYEEVLRNVRKYICTRDYEGVNWLDDSANARSGLATDIAYGYLPNHRIPGETNWHARPLWCEDKYTPDYLKVYLEEMKKYLQVEKILRSYCDEDEALVLSTLGIDYEEKLNLMKEFIKTYGYGPFEMIKPLEFTGRLIETPFEVPTRTL